MSAEHLPVGATVAVMVVSLIAKLGIPARPESKRVQAGIKMFAAKIHTKLHHINITDVVNVAVITDIAARIHQNTALCASVTGVIYLVASVVWAEE